MHLLNNVLTHNQPIPESQSQKYTTFTLYVGVFEEYTTMAPLCKWVDRSDNSKWLIVMLVQKDDAYNN